MQAVPLSVALGSSVSPNPIVTDEDGAAGHTYARTSNSSAVTFDDAVRLTYHYRPSNTTLGTVHLP